MNSSFDQYPPICGREEEISRAIAEGKQRPVYGSNGHVDFSRIKSACVIALHMHQPMIPTGGSDNLQDAKIISNLEHMFNNPGMGDNYNAGVFHDCYRRIGHFVAQLIDEGKEPRAMLDYSGTLLHGLEQMGLNDVSESLRRVTCDPHYWRGVEWLGTPWGHAVAPSTPVQDYRLHVRAWQQHFAQLFGLEALGRVRGFSPSEMALPNHPDVAYEFVKTLTDAGFEWVLVQEHTVEEPDTGRSPQRPHLPHRLVCRNSAGETASIVALIKTQGSDTKLVAQMQPWYEASGLSRMELAGHQVPPVVSQIADGENGGVMMNEFPGKFFEVVNHASGSETPLMNGTEYLENLWGLGLTPEDLPELQPIKQKAIWERYTIGSGPERLEQVIADLKQEDHQFHMEGGSWTNNISWVKGYDEVIGPMERVSALFNEKVLQSGLPTTDERFSKSLYYLMLSQTSCYRYWGQGVWPEYGREICRRAEGILEYDL